MLVADRLAGDAVQPVEAVEAKAPEHGVDGGAGEPERPGDALRPEALAAAHGADALLQLGCRAPGRGCAVLEPVHAGLAAAGAEAAREAGARLDQLREAMTEQGKGVSVTLARRELRKWLAASDVGTRMEAFVAELLAGGR